MAKTTKKREFTFLMEKDLIDMLLSYSVVVGEVPGDTIVRVLKNYLQNEATRFKTQKTGDNPKK